MVEEQTPQVPEAQDFSNPRESWELLSAGLKSRAMRYVFEEQQKLVVELQRQRMEMEAELAVGIVRARAAQDMNRDDLLQKIISEDILPKRDQLREMATRVEYETQLLNAVSQIGKGII